MQDLLEVIDVRKASIGDKSDLWKDDFEYPEIGLAKQVCCQSHEVAL